MKITRQLLLLIICFCFSAQLMAANRFWVSALASNWNNILNWSTVTGGLGGSSVPAAGDLVIFDNGGLGNCTIDIAVAVTSFTVNAGYTKTISQNGNSITLTGDASFSGGTFTGGSANITVGGNFTLGGTSFVSTSGLLQLDQNCTFTSGSFTHNSGTVKFKSTVSPTISGTSQTFFNLSFESNVPQTYTISTGTVLTVTGTLNTLGTANNSISTPVAGTSAIQAQGNIVINNTGAGGGGTAAILINGGGAQTLSSTSASGQGRLPYIIIQKVTGTLSLTGIISESRDWTYTSGTVDATTAGSTVVFGGNNLTIKSAGMNFYNVSFIANTSTLGNSLTVNNNLTISGLSILAAGANTINLAGNWANWGQTGFSEATSTVNFNGSAVQTITTPGGEIFTNLIVNNSGAGIKLINITTITTTLTMTLGNIDLNTNALTLGLSVANNGTLAYTAGTMINTGSFTRWLKAAVIANHMA
ncbi:MAG TPA: hypothetical protein VGZ71_05760, partial [Puia sp.]|nr:hypothetical protein [Puia sp.]